MKPTIRPTKKQDQAWKKLLDKTTRYVVFGGGAGGGKSWLGAEWLLTNCYIYPGTKWFMGREELKRLMGSSYETFRKVCKHHKIPTTDWKLNGQYNYIEFTNGSRIDLLDLAYRPTDPLYERLGSLEYTGGWIEEAGEIHFLAFDVLKSRVGRHMNNEHGLIGKIFITCNPKKNWLYQKVFKPYKEGTLSPEYSFVQSLYMDNPYTSEEYGKALLEITDKATKERLMKGNWEYDDDPSILIKYDAITDMFTNTIEISNDRYLTADIARYGSDKTVIYCWQGLHVYKIEVLEKAGIDTVSERIKQILKEEMIPYSRCIVDEDGVGGGVVDSVRGIKGFMANTAPIDFKNKPTFVISRPNYKNLKAQCYYLLADYINNHKILFQTEDENLKQLLIEELEQVKSKDMDKDGKLMLMPKDEVKEMIGRSPDYSDALMMRMWFELNTTGIKQYFEGTKPKFV